MQQGVEGLRLIWGKRTLAMVDLKAVGCSTKVTGGKLYWKKKDGTRQLGGKAYARWWDQPIAVEVGDPGTNVNHEDFEGLEYVSEFESNRSGFGAFFPLSQLAAIECVVLNHGVEVLNVEIPASELNFREIKKKLALIGMGVFAEDGATPWQEFWANAADSLIDAARIMPQPDFGPFYGSQSWMDIRSTFITEDSADLDSSLPTSDFARITSRVDGLIEPGFGQFGMALIDPELYVDEEDDPDPSGKAWVSPGDYDKTAVSFNFAGEAAPIIVQELCHMLGLVDGGAPNHDEDNSGHSLYDECTEYEDDDGKEQCSPSEYKTYSQAVEDQKGIQYPRMRRLTDGAPEKIDRGLMSDRRAKSSMSYAPDKENWNSFLEPEDHKEALSFLTDLYEDWADGDGGGAGAAPGGTALNLRFLLSAADEVQVTSSYVDESGDPTTAPVPEGSHRAVVLDAGGAPLTDLPFAVGFHTHGGEAGATLIALRIPFPEGARTVQIRHEEQVLWSASRSPNPPAVGFVAPAGGAFSAGATVQVSWAASDPDGDSLRFALDYSADGGATWIRLPQNLTGTTYAWRPGFLPKSAAAKLRLRASDGFNTAEALSAPFRLTPAQPLVFIRCPADGASIPEGSLVDLAALSLTSEGAGQGTFLWHVGGQPLAGKASGNEHRFETAGAHAVRVTLTDPSGLTASHEVTVQVFPDFDRDGLPNDWEQSMGPQPRARRPPVVARERPPVARGVAALRRDAGRGDPRRRAGGARARRLHRPDRLHSAGSPGES
ncbi:MAG: PKD domain-containing protein [Planctomycetes bacterium]|nr:PKD domain-containing protein [Planctomycetota bacterium]